MGRVQWHWFAQLIICIIYDLGPNFYPLEKPDHNQQLIVTNYYYSIFMTTRFLALSSMAVDGLIQTTLTQKTHVHQDVMSATDDVIATPHLKATSEVE